MLKWAVMEKFKDYLTRSEFTVVTDNNPVAHLQTAKLGAVEQHWVAQFTSYVFVVKYRMGGKMEMQIVCPDYLCPQHSISSLRKSNT